MPKTKSLSVRQQCEQRDVFYRGYVAGWLIDPARISPDEFPRPVRIKDLHQKMAKVAGAPGALNMEEWHSCETTHCRAGWTIVLAGDKGKELERDWGTPCAAGLIYAASTGMVPDFYASNAEALADIKRCAAAMKQKAVKQNGKAQRSAGVLNEHS